MDTLAEQIRATVKSAESGLREILAEDARKPLAPGEWSKQQILGHLIDSALNNHQRCVRGAYDAAELFPPYDQTRWVEIQGYNQRHWEELVEFWLQCNFHLCQVLERLSGEELGNLCNIGKEAPVTLEFVMTDYLRHLKMHLKQILERTI
jgi:hypothetical protein